MTSEILERGGTVVTTEYVPLGTTDLTPYMDHLLDVDASLGIDMLMVIWAGSFNDLYRDMTLKNIGSFMNVSGGVIDILSMTASELGLTTGTLINSTGLAVYGYELPNNPVNDWMVAEHVTRNIKPNGALGLNYRVPELFTASGFGTAQFMVNVTSEVPDLNVTNMICQLEGLNITTPKGPTYMRPEDHQGLAEMYIAKAVNDTRSGSETENQIIGELVETIPAMDVAPPIETDYVPCAGPSNQVTTTQTGTVTDTKVNTQTETDTVTVTPGFVSPYIILGLGLVAVALVNKNRRK